MKGLLQWLRVGCGLVAVMGASYLSQITAKPLEYNIPVCIRSQQFNRSLAVRAEFADLKATDAAAPFEMIAVADDHVAAKDGSALIIFKSAANPDKTGPIQFNEICTIEAVKAGTGAWADKVGFFPKRRLVWTFQGSKWNDKKDKDAAHFEPRVSDDTEPALKTDATHFAITSLSGKVGPIEQGALVNIVSRAAGQSNNRMMWVLNLDQKGVLPVLISSDDPWGRDPKSGLGGDRRIEAGKFTIGQIDAQLLNDGGWQDLARIAQEGKAKPGGIYASGGRSFIYEPAIFGKGAGFYSEQWKCEKPGTIWAKMKVKAKSDAIIYVSTQPKWMDAAGTYAFFFGAYKNSRSQIRKGTQVVMEVDVAKGGDPSVLVSPEGDDFWVSIEQQDDGKALLTAGKGPKVGENIKMSWTDEQPLKFVQYIGFGGWDSTVEYSNIAQTGNELGSKVPADFVHIPGAMKAVALSMQGGQVFLYGINEKGELLVWDGGSLKQTPWNTIELKDAQGAKIAKIIDVAAGADGTVAVVSGKRRVYFFNQKGHWAIVPNKLSGKKKVQVDIDRIAVGNAGSVIGLDKKKGNIYALIGDAWLLISEGAGLDIAAGYDGSLYALNAKHELFSWDAGAWKRLETGFAFSMISAVTKDMLYGIVVDGKKHKTYAFEKGVWEAMQAADGSDAVGLKDIIALPTKPTFIIVLDEQGNVYRKGEVAVSLDDAVKIGVPVFSAAVKAAEKRKKFTKKDRVKHGRTRAGKTIKKQKAVSRSSVAQKRETKNQNG